MKTFYQVGTRVVIQSPAAAPLARETVTTIPTVLEISSVGRTTAMDLDLTRLYHKKKMHCHKSH